MTDEEPQTIEAVALAELEQLWGDLGEARRLAINTDWSMQCDNLAWRIVMFSRFVGALPWEQVSVILLRNGVYERVYREAGIEYPPIDWAKVAEAEATFAGR